MGNRLIFRQEAIVNNYYKWFFHIPRFISFKSIICVTILICRIGLFFMNGVNISQPMQYVMACSSCECFILRAVRLSNKLLRQGDVKERLRSSLRKFYGRYGDLTKQYKVPLSQMLHDILEDNHIQWHPLLMRHYTDCWPFTDLDLITEFDFLPNCARFP